MQYQALAGLPIVQPFAYHGQPHAGDPWTNASQTIACSGLPALWGTLVFPTCSRVYCAQLGQLLALGSLDCPGHHSGQSSPSCMRIKIKASKTDPFRKGSDIHIGRGRHPLCAMQAISLREAVLQGLCFAFRMVNRFLVAFSLTGYGKLWLLQA